MTRMTVVMSASISVNPLRVIACCGTSATGSTPGTNPCTILPPQPGLLLNGHLLARFQRASVFGSMSEQPFELLVRMPEA